MIPRNKHREFFLLDHPAVDILIQRSGDPIIIQARNAGAVYLNAKVVVELMEGDPDDMLAGIHLQLRQQAHAALEKAEAMFEASVDLVNTLYLIETKCNCQRCKLVEDHERKADNWIGQLLNAKLS